MAVNEVEQQVWQRVRGEQPENSQLKALAMDSQEAGAMYRQLLKSRVESHRELGKYLLRAEGEILATLKGLHYLQTGEPLKLPMAASVGVDSKGLVRRYHMSQRKVAEFAARSAEPEWGCVFRSLAQRQETECELLCRLLGHMK